MIAVELGDDAALKVRVLPERGLDVSDATFAGTLVSWRSGLGELPPLARLEGDAWRSAWAGGLVTTCGLHNVGAPSEGHGLHGAFSHRRALDVRLAPERAALQGTVSDGDLVLRRTILVGPDRLSIRDVTRNEGPRTLPAPLLYHVNLGPPLWAAPARVHAGPSAAPTPRDAAAAAHLDAWDRPPEPGTASAERVFEHDVVPGADGWASATVLNPAIDLAVTVRWDPATLPRMHQWVDPALGVIGLEPANCSVLGRAADRAAGRLPQLDPGEERVTRLDVGVTAPAASGTFRPAGGENLFR